MMRIDYEKVAPGGYKALGGVYGYLLQCGIDPVLIEMTNLRVSQINGCAYCIDLHSRDLIKNGVTPEKLAFAVRSQTSSPYPIDPAEALAVGARV